VDIQDFRIFARVAAVQNLSQVGGELALTPGTISKRLQALEEDLGVRLFDRTTRSIRITEEGQSFLRHAERILSEFDAARAIIGDSVARPKGRLKVAAPTLIGASRLVGALDHFMRLYPEIQIQIDLTDRAINLQEDGYDVAIRIGALADSSVIAKRLAADPQVLVASPAYLTRAGVPEAAQALGQHACLTHVDATTWVLRKEQIDVQVKPGGNLRSNNSEYLLASALAGSGIAQLSLARVADEIAAGRLVRVLPAYEIAPDCAIWAVYPTTKHVLPKLRLLLDTLADWFRDGRRESPSHVVSDLELTGVPSLEPD
jgi:DNA-binding transcriptional LysR family regulator